MGGEERNANVRKSCGSRQSICVSHRPALFQRGVRFVKENRDPRKRIRVRRDAKWRPNVSKIDPKWCPNGLGAPWGDAGGIREPLGTLW